MATESEDRKKPENLQTIEGAREFFVDPLGEHHNELARITARTSHVLQQIYITSGRIDCMDPDSIQWLTDSSKREQYEGLGDLETVVGQVLAREAGTRRFDEKFFGQIHPQGSQIGIIANLVAAHMNTNTIVQEVSNAENAMESETLGWLADMFGYDRGNYSGNIETGGTAANITALWVAREWKRNELMGSGHSYKERNLYVIGPDSKHYSIVKACDLLGLKFVQVPTLSLKSDPKGIQKAISGLDLDAGAIASIVAIAGGTETGMVDGLNALADIAEKYNTHLHVDAAYGGPFILSSKGDKFRGINRADSITVDPHKMLYTPYTAGAILFKDRNRHVLIESSMRKNAGYLSSQEVRESIDKIGDQRNFGFSRLTGSMGAGGVISAWATIKLLGKEGIATLLNHTIELTNVAHEAVKSSQTLTPMHEPQTNTLLIAALGNDNKALPRVVIDYAQREAAKSGYYISVDDEIFKTPIFRFVAMHPYSTKENVEELISILDKAVQHYIKNDY